MRAAVVHGAGDLRVEDIPDPQPEPDEALVALEWGGICGSDLAYAASGTSGSAVLREPLILGHEGAGRILSLPERLPPGCTLAVGDAVTFHPARIDGDPALPTELEGRDNLHPGVRYFGSAAPMPHEPGLFSTHRAVPVEQLRVLPEAVTTRQAALAEPLAVALHAIARVGRVDGRVLVHGAGPIGLMLVAALAHSGHPRELWVADLNPAALDRAVALGAHHTVNPGAGEPLPQDVDLVFEASGAMAALAAVLNATRRGGRVVQVGNLPVAPKPTVLASLVSRELEWLGSYRFVNEIDDALALLAAGLDLSPAVGAEYDLSQAVAAFAHAADRGSSGKVLLRLS